MWQVLIVEDDPLMRDFFAASIARRSELALAVLFLLHPLYGWTALGGCLLLVPFGWAVTAGFACLVLGLVLHWRRLQHDRVAAGG